LDRIVAIKWIGHCMIALIKALCLGVTTFQLVKLFPVIFANTSATTLSEAR